MWVTAFFLFGKCGHKALIINKGLVVHYIKFTFADKVFFLL